MKKKQLACFVLASALTVMASSSLLCGNAIVSYEDVTDKTQTVSDTVISPRAEVVVSAPVHSYESFNAMVAHTWTGDEDGYMQIGTTQNPTVGGYSVIEQPTDDDPPVYTEYCVPYEGSSSAQMRYIWAKSIVELANGDTYSSGTSYYFSSSPSIYTVTGGFTSGVINSSGKTKSYSINVNQTLYISIAYMGEQIDITRRYSSITSDSRSYNVGGVVFTFTITKSSITVSTDNPIVCNRYSSILNGQVAIGYAVV